MTATDTVDYHNVRGTGRAREEIRDLRRIEVGRMLLARTPIRTIASRLNVSTATVQKDIKVVERWWQSELKATKSEMTERQVKILDELERAWIGRAMFDDSAVDVLLRIQARRAKLCGLDMPVQSQVDVNVSVDGLRSRALEMATSELERRRELAARAELASSNGEVIDV